MDSSSKVALVITAFAVICIFIGIKLGINADILTFSISLISIILAAGSGLYMGAKDKDKRDKEIK